MERRRARQSFIDYCEYCFPEEPPAEHHKVLGEALDKVYNGEIKNLAVFMPPGSAKSTYTSVRWPPYMLGRNPGLDFIQASNTAELAARFGRKARNIIDSKRYKTLFGTHLSADSKAKNQWEVIGVPPTGDDAEVSGEYFAIGVEGTVTGRRADGGLIDDPVKGREDADSERVRDKIWDWYLTDFTTRIKPEGFQVVIQTRWHEDDLSGRILPNWDGETGWTKAYDGSDWYVICIKAESTGNDPLNRPAGGMLWTDWFSGGYWDRIKKGMPPREWNALYQQNPTPDEGMYFERESIARYRLGEEPEDLHRYITSDFAVTEKATADFTVFGDWGVDSNGHWWLLEVYKDQSSASKWIDVLSNWIKTKKPLKVFGESGVIRRAIEDFLKHQMRQKGAYASVEWITRTRDKVAMAAAFRGLLEQGMVHIPLTDWGEDLVTELLKFPAGEHDDQVDMCTLLGLAVTQGVAATLPEPEDKKEGVRDYEIEQEPDNWKLA